MRVVIGWAGFSIEQSAWNNHCGVALFIMRPHSKNLHGFYRIQHLINKAMLDIDSARISTAHVTNQFLKERWSLIGIATRINNNLPPAA
jgi:hypothetical protein